MAARHRSRTALLRAARGVSIERIPRAQGAFIMRGDDAWHVPLRERVWYQRSAGWLQGVVARVTPDWLRSLAKRLVTAFVAIPIVFALMWFGGWVAFGGAVLILGLGIYELHSMFVKLGYHPLTWFSFIFGIILFASTLFAPLLDTPLHDTLRDTLVEATVSLLILGSLTWLLMRRNKPGTALIDWALTLVMTLYLAWPLSFLLRVRGMTPGNTPAFWWLMTIFFGVWAFDSAAFFAGRLFGKHLLAPTVSPGKTWEGTIGGTLLTLAAAWVFTRPISPAVAWYHALALGLLISFAATVGDLAESLIKRQAGVKDSGKFFWGHGGVLDRIDSLLFTAVVVYFYLAIVLHAA
jgi:phosphatidate cytidylyltransferase